MAKFSKPRTKSPPARPELVELLAGVKANPIDKQRRLILADWLEEHNEAARAELIRLQHDHWQLLSSAMDRTAAVVQREQHIKEILAAHMAEWLAPFREAAEQCGARLMQRVPAGVQRYLRASCEFGLVRLAIDPESLFSPAVVALSKTEAWAWVSELLPRLVIGDAGGLIKSSPVWAGIPHVDFEDCKLGESGAQALARVKEKDFTALRHLDVGHNALGPAGAAALAKAQWLRHIETIDLAHNRLCDDGAVHLATSPNLNNLRELDLRDNRIGDVGASALAGSPHFKPDMELVIYNNRISPAGAKRLHDRFGERVTVLSDAQS